MSIKDNLEEVKRIFSDYLAREKYRKTPERFTILEEVYSRNDHFDAEMLYLQIKNKNFNISRATVYNTLNLLQECDLVKKHQFGKNVGRFEKSYGFKQHDHLVCSYCSEVFEFCDPRIQQIQSMIGNLLKFNIHEHSLTLYGQPLTDDSGKCEKCSRQIS